MKLENSLLLMFLILLLSSCAQFGHDNRIPASATEKGTEVGNRANGSNDICSADELLKTTNDYLAQSNDIGEKLLKIRQIESTIIDRRELISIIVERRNLEDELSILEKMFRAHTFPCGF